MQLAKINPWNNNWFDVYDFTPHKFNTQNYKLEPLEPNKEEDVIGKIVEQMKLAQIKQAAPIIPRIIGKGQETLGDVGVLVAYPVPPPVVSEELKVIQSRVHNINQ